MPLNLLLNNWSQMPKIILITVLLFLSGLSVAEAETVSDENTAAKKLSEQLNENLTESPLNLKVRKLTMQGSQVSSEFADNLLRLISHELKSNTDDFSTVGEMTRGLTRGLIEVLPNEDEDPEAQDAFLEGTYRMIAKQVVVQLNLVGGDGKSISRAEISLPVSGVKHKLQPPNFLLAQKTEKIAAQNEAQQPKDFSIELGLNKADGATFREGESLEIFFRSEEDCYLLLFYQDVKGNRYILYPETELQRRTQLLANQAFNVTKELNAEFYISCDPACGLEMVWAFASENPVEIPGAKKDLNGSGFYGYPASFSLTKIIGQQRGIKRSEKKAEARVYLTTVAKK